jgi:hypothetical protein
MPPANPGKQIEDRATTIGLPPMEGVSGSKEIGMPGPVPGKTGIFGPNLHIEDLPA